MGEDSHAIFPETYINFQSSPALILQVTIQILVVDDDQGFRALCRRLLQKNPAQDYLLTEAADAASGLDAFSKSTFDCVLVDYRLPDMLGTDLIQALRQVSEDTVPMILLSAEERVDTASDACLAGAINYLPKSRVGKRGLVQAIQYAHEKTMLHGPNGVEITHQTKTTGNAG